METKGSKLRLELGLGLSLGLWLTVTLSLRGSVAPVVAASPATGALRPPNAASVSGVAQPAIQARFHLCCCIWG